MAKTKTTPASSQPALLDVYWTALFRVAEDARAELHKQLGGLIALANTALTGGTRLASVVNDQVADLAKTTLETSDRTGRELVASTRGAAKRSALRASATASALVGRRADAA